MNQATYNVPCVHPITTKDALKIQVPGSKSITNRALLLATLANGTTTLHGVLFSDDSRHFLNCIQTLGFETTVDEANCTVTIKGLGGSIPKAEASLYVGSAGTAARFLSAYLGCSNGTYHMDASEQMRKRPMAPLLASLKDLGCELQFEEKEGFFPFTITGHGFATNKVSVDIDQSSQFLSALLICACLSGKDMEIGIEGTHGMSYIEITLRMMEQFGVKACNPEEGKGYLISEGQSYNALTYQVEPDASSASYFYALAPLLGVPILVQNVTPDSMQGDIKFLQILEQLGCTVVDNEEGILLLPPTTKEYPGLDVDMSACSDQAITMAVLAPFATSPTTIRGIGHIRFQECDRLSAIAKELTNLGIQVEEREDSITIYPGPPTAGTVHTYDDHRMAMGFALIGLRVPGIVIDNPDCCRKTFENFFTLLDECIAYLK